MTEDADTPLACTHIQEQMNKFNANSQSQYDKFKCKNVSHSQGNIIFFSGKGRV
jgi:hypothetical protein